MHGPLRGPTRWLRTGLCAALLLCSLSSLAEGPPKRLRKADEIASAIKVAVLELNVKGFTDDDRKAVDRLELVQELRNLGNDVVPGLSVLTASEVETILAAQQIDPEKCEGLCAVELGKKVSADYVIDGAITKRDGYILDLRIWSMADGAQKKGIRPNGPDRAALLKAIQLQAPKLFEPIKSQIERVMEDEKAQLSEADRARQERLLAEAAAKADVERARKDKLAAEAEAKEVVRERERERARLRAQEEAKAKEAERRAEQEALPRHAVLRKVGWVTAGLGVVAGLAAGAGGLAGISITNNIKSGGYSTSASLINDSNRVGTINTVTKVAAGAGAALLLGGLGIVLFNQDPEGASVSLGLAPRGLAVAGRF